MISTSQLMALASDPATAAALIAAMTPEEAARILPWKAWPGAPPPPR